MRRLIYRIVGDAGLLRFMKRRAEAARARLMDLWGFSRVTVLRYSDGTEEFILTDQRSA